MPISSIQLAGVEDTINRLAAESVLAMPGRDDGLIPSYSLLGELREHCAAEPALTGPLTAVHRLLEQRLDNAQPFDEATLVQLRAMAEWLPTALEALKGGHAPSAFVGASAPAPAAAPTASASAAAGAAVPDSLMTLNMEENSELLNEFHGETVDHLQQIEAALLALEQQPDNPEALNSIFRSFHTIKGNAGFLGLLPMHTLAHEVESLLDLARHHKLILTSAIITVILRSRDALQALTQQVGAALEKGQLPTEIIPVGHLISAVRQLSSGNPIEAVAPASAAPAATPVAAPPEPTAATPDVPEAAAATKVAQGAPAADSGVKSTASQTVRVNTDKLDTLMNVVGELVIVQSQLQESTRGLSDDNSTLHRNASQLARITKELQHTAMSLRMIPVKPTFQKMERLARDLARNCGKKAHFQVTGEDTELDRTVVEEIADPLVHMVRNALDHGLEAPPDRLAAGKPETGNVHLSAYHQGSNIVIELKDDGRGIDPVKVLAKARKQGLVGPTEEPTRDEILHLIFAPGFSTAEKVTSVSGRGVGMDVVRRNIEKLRGKIEIETAVGEGSTFRIKLPLTMAIIDGLVVRVGEDRFILPSISVQMALRPNRENIFTVQGQGEVLEMRGRMLPIHRLYRRFGIASTVQQPWEGIVVIVEASGKVCALLVDEMVSKQEVVIKSLGAFMQGLPGVAGGAILGDGHIALILDPGTLLKAA